MITQRKPDENHDLPAGYAARLSGAGVRTPRSNSERTEGLFTDTPSRPFNPLADL